ncbi:unnamed protein product [Rotaria sp. Silwood1]|nr:unnamed protein product [Rotaria sp. Silwood1]
MVKTQVGLLSFNNFLSTSTNREVSLDFLRKTMKTSDLIGFLFVVKIDPTIQATPFANVCDISYVERQEEILFSMHSIFRIGIIKQIDENSRLWQVDLTLISGKDPELHALTEHTREETYPGAERWDRLGTLLIKLGQFDKTQELYEILPDHQAITDRDKALIYHQLGWVKQNKGEYTDAIAYYKQSTEIKGKILSPMDIALDASYNNIGSSYESIGDYSNALSFHQKALKICQETLPSDHPNLAITYNCVGAMYSSMVPIRMHFHLIKKH